MTLSVSRDSGRGFLSSKPARDDRTTRRPANPVELHTPLDQSARRRAGGTDAPVRVRVFHRRLRRIRSRSSLPYPHMVAFRTGQTGRCASCRRLLSKRDRVHRCVRSCPFTSIIQHSKKLIKKARGRRRYSASPGQANQLNSPSISRVMRGITVSLKMRVRAARSRAPNTTAMMIFTASRAVV